MKKFSILYILFLTLCTGFSMPAVAQNLSSNDQLLIKRIERAINKSLPSICLNGFCFRSKTEALAYCEALAESVVTHRHAVPALDPDLLKDTLTDCSALLKSAKKECIAPVFLAQAKEQGKKSFWKILSDANRAAAESYTQLSYVDGYRQIGQGIVKTYKDGYQNMAKGYTQVSYVDGYRQIGQGIAKTYKDGYQNMAKGYTQVSYVDGYRQIGQGIAKTYKNGYQNMAKGYTQVSYVDGYRQLWQEIKNFFKQICK